MDQRRCELCPSQRIAVTCVGRSSDSRAGANPAFSSHESRDNGHERLGSRPHTRSQRRGRPGFAPEFPVRRGLQPKHTATNAPIDQSIAGPRCCVKGGTAEVVAGKIGGVRGMKRRAGSRQADLFLFAEIARRAAHADSRPPPATAARWGVPVGQAIGRPIRRAARGRPRRSSRDNFLPGGGGRWAGRSRDHRSCRTVADFAGARRIG